MRYIRHKVHKKGNSAPKKAEFPRDIFIKLIIARARNYVSKPYQENYIRSRNTQKHIRKPL